MKKIILLLSSFLVTYFSFAQSGTIAPNYVVIPGVASLSACTNADKGKTVFNTTNNKMFFCDGTAWQSMAGVPSAGVGWAQNGADISNTNSGKVGIGTSTPSLALTVKGSIASGEIFNVENSTGSVNLVTHLTDVGTSSIARIRTNTASDLWLSASKFLPDFRIATNGNINMAEYTTGKVGIGTTTADEKLHVGGNIKVNEGIYSATTGGLNIVPLGVISVKFDIDTDVNLSNISVQNLAGNLALGQGIHSTIDSGDDFVIFRVQLNTALLTGYTKLFVVGAPNTFGGLSWHKDLSVQLTPYNSFNLNTLSITVGNDDFSNAVVTGDFMIYGVK